MLIPQYNSLALYVPCAGETTERISGSPITIAGPPLIQDGKIGKSSRFLTNAEYLNLGNISSILNTGTGSFTCAAWFRRIGITAAGPNVIFSRDTSGNRELNFYCDGNEDNSNRCILFYFSGASGIYCMENASSTNDTNWHHLVAVKNGTSSMQIYTDGIQRAATQTGNMALSKNSYVNNSFIGLGSYSNSTASMAIQHFMYWKNVALTAQEVAILYHSFAIKGGIL